MTLTQWLESLLTSAGAGTAIFMLIAFIEAALPPERQPTGQQKFYAALVLSLLVPPAAYGALVALGDLPGSLEGLFQVVGVAYMISQGLHRELAWITAPVQ